MSVQKKKYHKLILIPEIFIISSLIGFLGWTAYKTFFQKPIETPELPEIVIPQPESATSRLLFAGTTFWGRRTHTAAQKTENPYEFPFARLSEFGRENYQAWIGNLECPVTEIDKTTYQEETLLEFNCRPEYLPEAAKYFTAFSIGTNHTDNNGEEGIELTKQNLKANNIQYFGHYRYDNAEENCNIVIIPINILLDNGETTESKMPLGLCSAHGVFGIPTEAARENIARYAKYVPTIVMPHMGVEYQASADELRTNLFRDMIDHGADMVLADHPHWIQNSESYNGKLIVYSMGNFMFDQQATETNRGVAIDVTATFDKNTDFEAWNEISELCLEKDGNCLEEIQASGLEKYSLSWTNYNAIGTSDDGYQTHLASEAEQASIEARLNWEATKANLNQ